MTVLIGCFFGFGLDEFLTLDYLKSRHVFYLQFYRQNMPLTLGIYFMLLFMLTAFSVPGVGLIILTGGALFGFPITLVLTSFADALGSTAAFLSSRYLLGNSLQAKYKTRLKIINRGMNLEGAFYLFSLRLMPFFPCFLINLLMGLTTIRMTTYYWVTQVGKLPFNAIYINAGTQLGRVDSILDMVSPGVMASFVLIGLFPMMGKKALQWSRAHKEKLGI